MKTSTPLDIKVLVNIMLSSLKLEALRTSFYLCFCWPKQKFCHSGPCQRTACWTKSVKNTEQFGAFGSSHINLPVKILLYFKIILNFHFKAEYHLPNLLWVLLVFPEYHVFKWEELFCRILLRIWNMSWRVNLSISLWVWWEHHPTMMPKK